MPLNKSKGNMYPFITHTWNTIKGKCPHDCSYCYMKRFPQNDIRFDHKELETDLGKGNFIFVGSSCDMWADDVPVPWISNTLNNCNKFDNKYLFQSKNPKRFYDFEGFFPKTTYLGTTIETNRTYPEMGNTPTPTDRAMTLHHHSYYFPTMVTVEPIMAFDVDSLAYLVHLCNREWINIGADSKGHGLPEPNADKIKELIGDLRNDGIEVKVKDNLRRFM